MPTPEPETAGFCWHSRRWLVYAQDPASCPEIGFQGNTFCIGPNCGYYQERKLTPYIKRRLQRLREAFDKEE